MKPALITVWLLFIFPLLTKADTFIGNGGNMGDVEIEVAKKQIKETFEAIDDEINEGENICACIPQFSNHRVCDLLDELNKKQRAYCSKQLVRRAPNILQILNDEDLKISWTHNLIHVKEKDSTRSADAVTSPKDKTIIINQKRFLKMKPIDRFMLLTHEILHLVKFDSKFVDDEDSIGPYKGEDGVRELLNAMAAGALTQAYDYNVLDRYMSPLRRSQGWKKNYIDIGYGGTFGQGQRDNNFAMDEYDTTQVSYRHYFTNLGFILSYRRSFAEEGILSTIEAEEENELIGAGISYRYFPYDKSPLTTRGQSHLVVNLMAEHLTSQYKLSDTSTGLESDSTGVGANLECKYYIPMARNLWIYGGGNLELQQYEHSKLDIKYDSLRHGVGLGVSYGF